MTPTASSTSPIQNPDTIVQEIINPPDLLDPGVEYLIPGTSITQNVYEQLLYFHGSAADQVIPWLAQSYDVSSDGLTYTFHLRNGITFTDGTSFDANAVYYSVMRVMLIDDSNGPGWALLQILRGGMNYSKQYNNAGPSAPSGYGNKYFPFYLLLSPRLRVPLGGSLLSHGFGSIHVSRNDVEIPYIAAAIANSVEDIVDGIGC